MGSHTVEVKRAIKYLGVTLDAKQTFVLHLRAVSGTAVWAAKVIGRLWPNIGEPSVGDLVARERGDLRINEMAELDRQIATVTAASTVRRRTIVEWQLRLATETEVAAWTRRILSLVLRWIGRLGTLVSFRLA